MKTSAPIELAVTAIRNHFGSGAIHCLGSTEALNVDTLSTGSLAIDVALGAGGLPRGRIAEIYGPESSGKTTFCLSVIAEAQRCGGMAAIIDVEHALDPAYARRCGVKPEELHVAQPDSGEDALTIAEILIRSGGFDVVVVDSVAALVPRSELDGQMGDAQVGAQARLMSQALRRLTAAISKTQTILLFTNQLREKIGVMFGSPEVTPGGRALKFFASVRLDIRRKDPIKSAQGNVVGHRTRVKVVKNKVAAPFVETEFDLLFGGGISRSGTLIDFGLEHALLERKGAYLYWSGEALGQGREAARQYLDGHGEVARRLDLALRERLLAPRLIAPESTDHVPAEAAA